MKAKLLRFSISIFPRKSRKDMKHECTRLFMQGQTNEGFHFYHSGFYDGSTGGIK